MCHTIGTAVSTETEIRKLIGVAATTSEKEAGTKTAPKEKDAVTKTAPEKEDDCMMTRVLTAVATRVVTNPQTTVLIVGCIHTVVAFVTFMYVRKDFDDLKPAPSYALDLMFQVLYAMTIDAVCVVFVASRSGVRAWHWKINTGILIPCLCFFFVTTTPAMIISVVGYFVLMKFVYKKVAKEADVYPVGLSKYIKGGDEGLVDLRWSGFRRCMVVTLAEAVTTSLHMVCFLSPVIFFILHSAYVQMVGITRSKLSSLYTVTFTSSMDTGMCVAMLDFPAEVNIVTDACVIAGYWALLHVLVKCNDRKIQRCYELINNKNRYIAYAVWLIVGRLTGTYKHNFASFAANLLASMFIGWTTVYGWETKFNVPAYGEKAGEKVEKTD
ncbi:hypothetical protein DIPPA_06744 [Diplonema papillatum]|nr:hypothetical protein DIPPA_06785 [Diplonema papillatum]KAJ9458229.1 hypothetical protein DIPPA_06744 [Diplonema papillatum]